MGATRPSTWSRADPRRRFHETSYIGDVAPSIGGSKDAPVPSWTFLTNHGHVLVCIAGDPGIRGRDIAAQVGITERAAQAIVADLVKEGYVQRTRNGRRNHYKINPERPLRHRVEQPHNVGELLQLVSNLGTAEPQSAPRS